MTGLLRFRFWRPVFALAAVAIAGYLLHRAAGQYSIDEILASLRDVTTRRLLLAILFAAASYLCLTGFDTLAVRYVRQRVPYPYVALTSFASLSLGHNIGFAVLSSGTIRFRFYARYGLTAIDIAGVILFCGLTVGIGLATLGGIALWSSPHIAAGYLQISPGLAMLVGGTCGGIAIGYVLLCRIVRRPLSLRGWPLRLPDGRLAAGQLVLGSANFALVAACLHQAIGGSQAAPYLAVAAVYVLANVVTLISHVPGGLGVIEGVVLALLPSDTAVGGVILFRVIYFFVPLVLGTIAFALSELLFSRRRPDAQS